MLMTFVLICLYESQMPFPDTPQHVKGNADTKEILNKLMGEKFESRC